jgi:acyl carrier protein
MTRDDVHLRLTALMRDFFANPDLTVHDAMTAAEVPGWDSLAHINFVLAVETEFGITLGTRDVRGMKNVGAMMDIVAAKAR